jgi:sugar (pentulose or hexulose) kinase
VRENNTHTAVFDVGKTHSKLSLWSAEGELVARRSRSNARIEAGRYWALDARGIEAWAALTLAEFATLAPIGTIIPVGHGAAAALVRRGKLACPPFDYESTIPPDVRIRYAEARDDFALTGSPALPNGLNLGAQLFWLEEMMPALVHEEVKILTWAQYWAWVLSGVVASEVTSLGCHTDLWRPATQEFSALAVRRGWAARFSRLHQASDILGTLLPEWTKRTGLAQDTQVLCGLHDSNAALLAARGSKVIANHEATVVSTGTWFVAMRSPLPGENSIPFSIPEHRDCLINVDVSGKPIPSARFMGGRELEMLTASDGARLDQTEDQRRILGSVTKVIATDAMALPTLTPGFGPYPHARHRWRREPQDPDAHRAAAGLYAALVMQTSLSLIEAEGTILIEGRFAEADVFVRALAALLPKAAVYVSHAHNGVPYGALRLKNPNLPAPSQLRRVEPLPVDLTGYAADWKVETARSERA